MIDFPAIGVPAGVLAVIVNYRTPDLLDRSVFSLRQAYPHIQLLLIDNGSGDESATVCRSWKMRDPDRTGLILNERNLHHGPAMDQALRLASAPFLLFIDSDCRVLNTGFIEEMLRMISEKDENYAVGKLVTMNRRGFDVPRSEGGSPYIRPVCMLIRRSLYIGLPPFRKHGTPCLRNMVAAVRKGYRLLDYPVFEHVRHDGRGTASRFGYRLGLRGIVNHFLNRAGL